MLTLTKGEVAALLDDEAVIHAVEAGHARHAAGAIVQPTPTLVRIPGREGVLVPMIAALDDPPLAVVKLMTDIPTNASRQLPTQQSTILVINLESGRAEALLEGSVLTRFRTAAASAVATRHLARQDASVLALIGAGALASAHLRTITRVRGIREVRVWSRTRASSEKFAKDRAGTGLEISVSQTVKQAVADADIVCTLTPSKEPLLCGSWVSPGTHLNVVGAPPRPDHREVDTSTVARARLVVDSRDVVLKDSGDILMPIAEGALSPADLDTELGDVILGAKVGRTSAEQITLYKSIGVALQDAVTARLVLERARKAGVGTEIGR